MIETIEEEENAKLKKMKDDFESLREETKNKNVEDSLGLGIEVDQFVLCQMIDNESCEGEGEDRIEKWNEPEQWRSIDQDQDDRNDAKRGKEESRIDGAKSVEEIGEDSTSTGEIGVDV